jgi:Na+-translocating ferredoxin:NAD+ oxidoreductase RnfG subunit
MAKAGEAEKSMQLNTISIRVMDAPHTDKKMSKKKKGARYDTASGATFSSCASAAQIKKRGT